MKKKLMMVAVITGLFSLGACVDDKESPSVEAQRNAKTEQLKSIAAMNNAQAEATKTLAAADAALKAAQAEATKVQNDLKKVEIEREKVRLEMEKVQLEIEKVKLQFEQDKYNMELQVALKEFENQLLALDNEKLELDNEKAVLEARKIAIAEELKQQEIWLESELLRAQTALLYAQRDLKNAQDGIDAEEKAKLQILVNEYTQAVTDLNGLKQNLFGLQRQLTFLENGLADYKESQAQLMADNQIEIAKHKAQIEVYKKYSAYLPDYEDVLAKYEAKEKEYLISVDKLNALWSAYLSIKSEDFVDPKEINESKYVQAYRNLYENLDSWEYRYIFNEYWDYRLTSKDVEKEIAGNLEYFWNAYQVYVAMEAIDGKKLSTLESTIQRLLAEAKNSEKQQKEAYEAGVKAAETAKKAWEDAKKEEEPNIDDIESKAKAYKYALVYVDNLKMYLDWESENVVSCSKMLSDLNILLDAKAYKEYTDLVDKYNKERLDAATPRIEAYFAYFAYDLEKHQAIEQERTVLQDMLYVANGTHSATFLADRISELETDIEDLEKAQIDIQEIENQEQMIEFYKAQIEAKKAQVAVAQVYLNNAKAALDAAMPKE